MAKLGGAGRRGGVEGGVYVADTNPSPKSSRAYRTRVCVSKIGPVGAGNRVVDVAREAGIQISSVQQLL